MEPAVARRETWRRKETTARQLSKRGRDGVDAVTTGEFVRLATAIDGCVAFNPTQWRDVLDKSTIMLRHSQSDGVQASYLNRERKEKKQIVLRPLSREEDTCVASDRILPPLSLTQYLNQPNMVKDLLKEVQGEKEQYQEVENDTLVNPELQVEQENENFHETEQGHESWKYFEE
ncbi:Hypothetical protein PHPALM_15437 [Phytophthora palmivora]|uniref:Uncharacterized protein n=1 Tax=Phytophthora palmivora TaxID=4796 RepID=A0A2P4XS65_9STRA|nr:Hypothetical protein PHPALM_15437 [Phytophthora palmivora]